MIQLEGSSSLLFKLFHLPPTLNPKMKFVKTRSEVQNLAKPLYKPEPSFSTMLTASNGNRSFAFHFHQVYQLLLILQRQGNASRHNPNFFYFFPSILPPLFTWFLFSTNWGFWLILISRVYQI